MLDDVAPGDDFSGGVGYELTGDGPWHASTTALISRNRYWSAQVDAAYERDRVRAETYGRVRHMPQLDFFKSGIDSDPQSRANFSLRESIVGGLAGIDLNRWIAVGGRAEEIWPELGRGRSFVVPSIEEFFDDRSAPGLGRSFQFARYGVFLRATSPAGLGAALLQGGQYRIGYDAFTDQESASFSFRRFEAEAQQKLGLFGRNRRLTLHGWLSTDDIEPGQEVPFFLQPTLGGTENLRSVDDELIGTDGGDGTLRGFRNLRFHDRHLILLQAEYRVSLWGPIDTTVFMDAGKVTSRRSALNLSGLKRDYGFSVSVMRGPETLARVDVGLGGGEGVRTSFMFGRYFGGER